MIYSIADVLQKGISFLTMPIFSYYILPEELGLVANFDTLVQIVMLLAFNSIVSGGLTYFFYERSHKENAVLISNLILLFTVIILFAAGIIFVFNNTIQKYAALSLGFQLLTIVMSEAMLLNALNSMLYRLEEKPLPFVTINITYTIFNIAFLFYFLVYLKIGGIGKIYAHLAVNLIFCIVNVILLIKRGYIVIKISKSDIKSLLNFGIPLIPHSAAFWIKGGLDKILLTTLCGLAANGLYSMAMTFGAVYSIFKNSFTQAYNPYIQKRISKINTLNENDEKRAIVKQTYWIIAGFFVAYFPIVVFCWCVIHYLLSDKYEPSFQFVPWIILSMTINTIYELVVKFVYTAKKTAGLGIITFCGSIVQCILTYLFIIKFGADGVKYGLVSGSLIIMIFVWIYSQKVYPMPWLIYSNYGKNNS